MDNRFAGIEQDTFGQIDQNRDASMQTGPLAEILT